MKIAKYILMLAVIIVAGVVFFFFKNYSTPINQQYAKQKIGSQIINKPTSMQIASTAFENNGNIPKKYTCDGENISPPLEFSDVPTDAISLVLILHDPDAPISGGFTHWVVFNIDPSTKEIAENSSPVNAVQGENEAGQSKYTSPCPPSGAHHYEFRLYALDEKLALDSSAKKADVEKAIEGHIIEQYTLTGLYQRS